MVNIFKVVFVFVYLQTNVAVASNVRCKQLVGKISDANYKKFHLQTISTLLSFISPVRIAIRYHAQTSRFLTQPNAQCYYNGVQNAYMSHKSLS